MSFRTNNNKLAERRAAKQRAEEYKEARKKPGADKGKLKKEYLADKRARKADKMAESKLRYGAFQRRFQEKKYNKDKDKEGFNPSDHSEYLNKTGAFEQKRVDAYNDFMKNYGNYKRKPGSLSNRYG